MSDVFIVGAGMVPFGRTERSYEEIGAAAASAALADAGLEWRQIQAAYLSGRSEQFDIGGVSTHVYLELESELACRQDHPALLETASNSYHLLHAGAGISVTLSGRNLGLDIQVHNLLNTSYIDHLSTLKPLGYLNMGRSVVLNLSIPLLASGT